MLKETKENELLKIITSKFIEKNELTSNLTNISDIKVFFRQLSENQNIEEDKLSQYILQYIYYKFSEKEVRLRKVTARNFEDFIGNIYGLVPSDDVKRSNPFSTEEIKELSKTFELRKKSDESLKILMKDWNIESDLCKNKREKADILKSFEESENSIEISIKTLKGKIGSDSGNTEINIGSLSYRSLFVDIYNQNLGDRKAGLGSGAQVYKVLTKIDKDNKLDIFKKRLKIFLDYLYGDDDFLIAYKSDKKMQMFFFEGNELVKLLTELLDKDIKTFSDIFYRWENNNLRIQINKLLNPTLTKIWTANSIEDIVDYPKFENIDNPFSKKNMVILNMENSLNNSSLNKIIEVSNNNFITNFFTEIEK